MADRVDENGAAYAGSQLQTQLYVNKRTVQLDDAIRATFPALSGASLDWRSPLAADRYAEYFGAPFLQQLGLDEHVDALARFWPRRGPQWDALAVVKLPDATKPGVVLVEGKSYPAEMLGGPGLGPDVQAKSRASIEKALAWTQGRLGVPLDTGPWTGPLYQNANRLAHLCFLEARGVRAWLAHLLFTDDPHGPTSAEQWEAAVADANAALGIAAITVGNAGHVVLPAGTRAELLG